MLKQLSEDLKSIKKIQSEMKDTLIEIKNTLQGNKSRVKLKYPAWVIGEPMPLDPTGHLLH